MSTREAEKAGTSQPTLFDVSSDGVIHDFVHALAYSGISIHQADGPLGDFVRNYCK
ncbi:unnamed protein product, partial [Ixodes hexagonus]